MLEFDGQAIDPAIVSAQPMKPTQTIDLQQMVCPPGRFAKQRNRGCVHFRKDLFLANKGALLRLVHPDSRLPQASAVTVKPEPTQVRENKYKFCLFFFSPTVL